MIHLTTKPMSDYNPNDYTTISKARLKALETKVEELKKSIVRLKKQWEGHTLRLSENKALTDKVEEYKAIHYKLSKSHYFNKYQDSKTRVKELGKVLNDEKMYHQRTANSLMDKVDRLKELEVKNNNLKSQNERMRILIDEETKL